MSRAMSSVSDRPTTVDQRVAPPAPSRGDGRVARWSVSAIRGYQLVRSGRPSGCRFVPTCSEYAIEAITARGAVRGAGLAARRLLRCHPWGGHGVDPVPGEGASCSH